MSRCLTGLFVCTDKAKRIDRISVLRILLLLSHGSSSLIVRVKILSGEYGRC